MTSITGTDASVSGIVLPGTFGVRGDSGELTGSGVQGLAAHGPGVLGYANLAAGVIGYSNRSAGVVGVGNDGDAVGVRAVGSGHGYAIEAVASLVGGGVYSYSQSGPALLAESKNQMAVAAINIGDGEKPEDGSNVGVYARTNLGISVYAESNLGQGVYAQSDGGTAIYAKSTRRNGIIGISEKDYTGVSGHGENIGVYAYNTRSRINTYLATRGLGGDFYGSVFVHGRLDKFVVAFKIDHPLDPANKTLSHACVESPEMKNIYDGVIALDERGEATVQLPPWLQTLNKEFRYQLTCIGEHAPVFVAREVECNQFGIAGGRPGMKVSWQLTGIRQDAWAMASPFAVEEDKPAAERGSFLHPEALGEPEERGVQYVRYPQARELRSVPTPPVPATPRSPSEPTAPR